MKSCCNPFDIQGHAFTSSRKGRKLAPVSEKQAGYINLNFAGVAHGNDARFICVACSIKLNALIRGNAEPPPPVPVTPTTPNQVDTTSSDEETGANCGSDDSISSGSDDGESGDSDSSESEDNFSRAEVVQSLEKTFATVHVSPLKKTSKRILEHELKMKCKKVKVSVSQAYLKATGSPLSPQRSTTQKNECSECAKLTSGLANCFAAATVKTEKYKILTCVPRSTQGNKIPALFGCSVYMARKARRLKRKFGPLSFPPPRAGRKLSAETADAIREFYMSDENSRVLPGLRDTIVVYNQHTQQKERVAKKRILMTQNELYKEFIAVNEARNLKISLSTFARLRPKQCYFPGKAGVHVTCTCVVHENFWMLLDACDIKLGSRSHTIVHTADVLRTVVCDLENPNCMLGACPKCPNTGGIENLFAKIEDSDDIEFYKWTTTDGVEITKQTLELQLFKDLVKSYIPKMLTHHFVNQKQKQFFAAAKLKMKDEGSVIIMVDFGENYSFIVQNAVQGHHWNNTQATIHPFVLFYYNDLNEITFRSYTVISDCMEHSATSFHVFRQELLKRVKEDQDAGKIPQFQKIMYFSDGAGSQYKNYKNFVNLAYHYHEFGVKAEWHFTATAHGKSMCDAVSAVCKRTTRLASLKENVIITNALQMFDFLQKNKNESRDFLYVTNDEVASKRADIESRYELASTVKGTRSYHAYEPLSETQLTVRKYSSSEVTYVVNIQEGNVQALPAVPVAAGQHIAFVVNTTWQLGIVAVEDTVWEGEYYVNYMRRRDNGNGFVWGDPPKDDWVPTQDVLCVCPVPFTTNGRTYRLADAEYDRIQTVFERRMEALKTK